MRLTPTALVLFLAALLARAAGSTEPAAAAGGGGGRERIPIMPTKVKRKTLEDAGLMSVRAPVLPKTLPPVSLMKRENDRAVVDRMADVIKGGGGDEVEEEEEGARAPHMSVMPKLSKPVSEMTDRELMERADSLGHDVDLANKIVRGVRGVACCARGRLACRKSRSTLRFCDDFFFPHIAHPCLARFTDLPPRAPPSRCRATMRLATTTSRRTRAGPWRRR